ncbi:MAG: PilC/PilY family type IV pilus protein [Thermodesulfobacteriota bacterium]
MRPAIQPVLSARFVLLSIVLVLAGPGWVFAACGGPDEQPPFLAEGVDPNLLILFDNSASMMDMAYVGAQGTCFDGPDAEGVESYQSGSTYAGYFTTDVWYLYDFADNRFEPTTAALAASTCASAAAPGFTVSQYTAGSVCASVAEYDYPDVIAFAATGNFLNWVSASKVDIEKEILTGGKYDTSVPGAPLLVLESRGCLDKRYVKKTAVTKTGGGTFYLSLAVRPPEAAEKAGASDDTTRIEFYQITENGFDNSACQLAIDLFASENPSQGQIKQAIDDCMGYDGGSPNTLLGASNAAFNHSIHNCWYMTKHGIWPPGAGTVQSMENACQSVYDNGLEPQNIQVTDQAYPCYGIYNTNPALRQGYVGRCWLPGTPAVCTSWYTSGSKAGECKTWSVAVPGSWESDACVEQALQDYCGYLEVPTAVDPSDQLAVEGELWNIPAVLIDSGVLAQMDDPMHVLKGQILATSTPSGLIQEFASSIRMGVMVFNDFGCTSGDGNTRYDCSSPTLLDGGRVATAIDQGSAHTTTLVASINAVKAKTWTPLAEAMYNALGYFTQDTGKRINASDWTAGIDPVQAWCQDNNILVISEGASTMDLNAQVTAFYNTLGGADGDGDSTAGCDSLSGSTLFDDLVWYGKHGTDIYPVEPWAPDKKRMITTYAVATGTNRTGLSGECDPSAMLEEVAANGGTTLYHGENPATLEASLRAAFESIRTAAAAGSAASVISASRGGEGALYQAIFWPNRVDATGTRVKWVGEVHALLVDAQGNLYEDTNGNRGLDGGDQQVAFYFDENQGLSLACLGGLNASGGCDGGGITMEQVHYLWSAVDWLASINDANIGSNRPVALNGEFQFSPLAPQRYIFTWEDLDNDGVVDSNETLEFVSRDWLDASLAVSGGRGPIPLDFGVQTSAEVNAIVQWVRGLDQAGMRGRRIEADFDLDGTATQVTWRLGDVIHSTPIAVSRPQEAYHYLYRDSTYANFADHYNRRRHVIYFGGNDGMLHAVNGGFYDADNNRFCRAAACNDEGGVPASSPELGAELWAYVPYNLLPHLKCLTDSSYDHKYYVDLRPRLFDVQIFADDSDHPGGWGTILVAGMRFGGTPVVPSTLDLDGVPGPDYPADNRTFTSAYFILDVTNPEKPPQLLAEYTVPNTAGYANLGYTISIPTMIPMKQGTTTKWYLTLGSGPTALDGTSSQQARLGVLPLEWLVGASRRAFRIPASQPTALSPGGSFLLPDSGSFISDLITVDFDLDSNYMADAVYFGTVSGSFAGWGGKLYRLVTRRIVDGDQALTEPDDWAGLLGTNPKPVIDLGRPVTATPAAGWDGRSYWVYFGTGRFLHPNDKSYASSNAQEAFYGIKEPQTWAEDDDECVGTFTWETVEKIASGSAAGSRGLLQVDRIQVAQAPRASESALSCSSPGCLPAGVQTFEDLVDYIAGTGSGCSDGSTYGTDGWYKEFHEPRERNVGQATLLGGLITFTSYQPFSDVCRSEGQGYLYGVYYQTGTPWYEPVFGEAAVTGDQPPLVLDRLTLSRGLATTPSLHVGQQEGSTAFVQTSTGTIIEIPQPTMPIKNIHTGRTHWKEVVP